MNETSTAVQPEVHKRVFDIVVSATALLLLSPALIAIAAIIRMSDGGPALYVTTRIGKNGRPFEMFKFRTMIGGADKLGGSSTASDDTRITTTGRWLRQYKLDELPQLWNVLIGDMSIVGPRPQVPWAVRRYTQSELIVLTVQPGITDPASLRFANEAEILRGHPDPDKAYFELIHPEKMRLSLEYVRSRTFLGDLRIIGRTILAATRLASYSVDPVAWKIAQR